MDLAREDHHLLNRRQLLGRSACGLGMAAFAPLSADTETKLEELTSPPKSSPPRKPTAQKIGPERFHEVDTAANLMVWLMLACGVGGFLIFLLIIVGARRMRRMTRTQVLKSKYDELEMLRERHRREIAQLEGLEPPRPDK